MNEPLLKITDKILHARKTSSKEIKQLYLCDDLPLFDLLWAANKIRGKFKTNKVELCSIVNAKSGNCSEDCKFCAQSIHHNTKIERYPLLDEQSILKAAKSARANSATCFGIVTSGKRIQKPKEISGICKAVKMIRTKIPSMKCSVSLGAIDKRSLSRLKEAGIKKIHHNLETSENYFPNVCTTHTYEERLKTLRAAKKLGIRLCSGGIFGLGESRTDRLDLAFTLRELDVDSVPLNFLHPVKGTALENSVPMAVSEILRTIAIFRLILPKKDIKVCGGRAVNLRSMQSMIFFAGANGMMIGNYLTQAGQDSKTDLKMIKDLGLRVTGGDDNAEIY